MTEGQTSDWDPVLVGEFVKGETMRQVTIEDVKAGVEWVNRIRADGHGRWASMLKLALYEEVLLTIGRGEYSLDVLVGLAQASLGAANVKPPDERTET